MVDSSAHPARNRRAWERKLRDEVIPHGLRLGKIRLLTADEISESPCLVASGAPRNPTGTHASKGYPGGRRSWIRAFECWLKKIPYDSLIGTLRRPYQHAGRVGYELHPYPDLPGRKAEADEVRVHCWPEHYGLTIWRRPPEELSKEDWECIARILAAEIKYRKSKGSRNPYEDAYAPNPIERIRDWRTVVDISREAVLASSSPWDRRQWVKSAAEAIWSVNRLSSPRGRISADSERWEELPHITIPSPSPFNSRPPIHAEIETALHKGVTRYERSCRSRLNRVIKKGQGILGWWQRLCSISQSELQEQSEIVSELWKEAENHVRERHGVPRIGEGWVSEVTLLGVVRDAFPDERVVHRARTKWLGRQHLDIFLPKRNVAIEYQGKQHFVPVDFFGGWDGLYDVHKRDKRKRDLCTQHGVKLIYWRFDEPVTRGKVKHLVERWQGRT